MKLSVITINLNNVVGLKKTIESVIYQTFTDYEYIIIDGGSTDGSVDIIIQYADRITYWVSESDKGIYNAMNKGILRAKGEYCLFLNSGDYVLENNGIQRVFDNNPHEDILYCDTRTENHYWKHTDKLTFFTFYSGSIAHSSTFIKTTLFSNIGLYNEENKIISDWEFLMVAIVKQLCSFKYFPFPLTFVESGGISSNPYYAQLHSKERETALKKHFLMMYDDYKQINSIMEEIRLYRDSRLIQIVRKMQKFSLYKWLMKLKIVF